MKSLSVFVITLACYTFAAAQSISESKSCFLNYMLDHDLIDKSFETRVDNQLQGVSQECEATVNSTLQQIKSASSDECVTEHLNRRLYSETILREYLMPTFNSSEMKADFDQLPNYLDKAVNVTKVICDNPATFKPDVKELLARGGFQENKMSKEIGCLHHHIKNKGRGKLDDDCRKIVDLFREEFYQRSLTDMKKVFAAPNDKLIDFNYCTEIARRNQAFEKVFFFVVMAVTRKMNDRQIETLRQTSNIMMATHTKSIYECILREN